MVLHQCNLISLKLMLYKREENMAHIFCMVINCIQLKKEEFLLWEEIHVNVVCYNWEACLECAAYIFFVQVQLRTEKMLDFQCK